MIKIVKALEDSDILVKGVTKTLKNHVKRRCFTNFTNVLRYLRLIINRKFIKWKMII